MSAGVGGIEAYLAAHGEDAIGCRECEWCSRVTPRKTIRELYVGDEPCPEEFLKLCPSCLKGAFRNKLR